MKQDVMVRPEASTPSACTDGLPAAPQLGPRRPARWPLLLAGMWLLLTLAVAAYSTLKPSTTAAELRYLPPNWVVWLDENYDLRTLVMALAVMLLPAILLASGGHNARRRWILVLATGGLMGLEAAQLWIPTRGFSWADLSYSLAGGLLPELLVLMLQWLGVVHRQQAAVCPAES